MSASPPEEINYRHQAIADEMLANPWMTQGDIAEKLGFTQSWLSTIVNSGTFQAYLQERRQEFNQILASQAQRKSLELGMKAMDKAAAALDADEVDPVEVFDKALSKAGMAPKSGGPGQGNGPVQNNYYLTATKEELASARGEIMENHKSSGEEGGNQIENNPSGKG